MDTLQLLKPEEAAERLDISPKTLRDWLRAGRFPGIKLDGLWRIRLSTIRSIEHRLDQLDLLCISDVQEILNLERDQIIASLKRYKNLGLEVGRRWRLQKSDLRELSDL